MAEQPSVLVSGQSLKTSPEPGFRDRRRGARLFPVLVVAAAAAIVFVQLLVPPVVGVADNGDFPKMLGPYGLRNPTAYWQYIGLTYELDPAYFYDSGFYSTERLFIRIALALNPSVSEDGSLDLRLIGLVHGAVFLAAVMLFVPLLDRISLWMRLALSAAALFMFGDVMYVSYMNSFYMDIAAYLSLLLATVFYLRAIAWRRPVDAAFFVTSSLMLIASKPQYSVLGLWLAALAWSARGALGRGRNRVAGLVSAGLLLVTLAAFRFEAPAGYAANNCFNVVFSQILPASHNVDRTMADLGLDSSYRKWIHTNAYTPGSPMGDPVFSEAFSRKIDYWRIGRFYLTHPLDAWRAFHEGLSMAGRQREPLGNFDYSAGRPPLAESRSFAAWSDLKRLLFHNHGSRLFFGFLLLAGYVAALLWRQRRTLSPECIAGAAVLIGTALTAMLVASFADVMDHPRHHLVFFAEFDMLVLVAVWLSARQWMPRR